MTILALLLLAFAAQTVRQDDTPLRSGCGETDKVVAQLKAGEPLQVKFGLAGAARPCFLVTATIDGKTVEGYLPGSALTGLDEFEQARRAAAPVAGSGATAPAPPAAAPTVRAAVPLVQPAGEPLPDFSFTDFDGSTRRLSEFSGRYVLLDFWGSWCGPCRKETPFLKEAYARFRSRGLEIVGMDWDDDAKAARQYVAREGITWTQAATPSIRDVVNKQFKIRAFPTTFLLDPQRRIIPLPYGALRGNNLLATLDRVLR